MWREGRTYSISQGSQMPCHPWAGWGGCGGAFGTGLSPASGREVANLHYPLVLVTALQEFWIHALDITSLLSPRLSSLKRLNANISSIQFNFTFQTTGGAIAAAQHIFISDMFICNVYVLPILYFTAWGFFLVHRSASLLSLRRYVLHGFSFYCEEIQSVNDANSYHDDAAIFWNQRPVLKLKI